MNQRIKELALKAGDYVNSVYTPPVRSKTPGKIWEDGHIGWHEQFNQKFAELIVQECVNVALEQKKLVEDQEVFNPHDESWNRARIQQSQRIVDKINEHFGVEQ